MKRKLPGWSVLPQRKRVKYVKRGPVHNTWIDARRYYGFLTRTEGPPGGPWHILLECTSADWMERAWMLLPADERAALLAFLGRGSFHAARRRASYAELALLAGVSERFVDLVGDEALPAMDLAIYEAYIDEEEFDRLGLTHPDFTLQSWFLLAMLSRHGDPDPNIGTLREECAAPPFLSDPLPYAMIRMLRVKEREPWWPETELSQAVLLALHTPTVLPPLPSKNDMQLD